LVTASIGVIMLACSTEGWAQQRLSTVPRILLFIGALCLVVPEPITDALGLALALAAFGVQRLLDRRALLAGG
jgi:TRAP-type uncharacterized transport system fused permease subunit